MKSENFQLLSALDESSAMVLARVLNAVRGISKVNISTTTNGVAVDFDEEVTSKQELQAVLQQAGFAVKKRAHGEEGMCCGSCGG